MSNETFRLSIGSIFLFLCRYNGSIYVFSAGLGGKFLDMDVSVIIVNYNTKDFTRNCIESVFAQTTGVSFEVILVDNASTDGSVEFFKKDNRIRFVESGENLGFGKANNLGYQYASGDYIFLLNSDTLLLNNAVKLFYDKMETADIHIGCMGCLLQDKNRRYIHSYAEFPKVEHMLYTNVCSSGFKYLGWREMKMDDPLLREINPSFFQVDYVTGADLFIRRNVIEKCGLFDPDFFMYYEDPELQYRFHRDGYFSFIFDAPQIMHLEGKSSENTVSAKMGLIKFDSALLYMSKTQSRWKFLLLKFLLWLKCPYTFFRHKYTREQRLMYVKSLMK